MLIKRIRLENFKKFKSLEKEFSPGINVVKGTRNETGKSTLLEGILVALFENPKGSGKTLDSLWTWGTDEKSHLYLEFSADSKDYVLDKDFKNKRLQLIEQDTQKRWDMPRTVEEKLRDLLGTVSRDLFLSTCCIRQDEVRTTQSRKTKVEQSMEQIITGGAQGVTATEAIQKLDSIVSKLEVGLKSPAKYPGPIATLQERVNRKWNELKRLKDNLGETEKLRSELLEVEKQIAELKKKIDISEKLLDNNRQRQEIENRIAELNKEYNTLYSVISDIDSAMKDKQSLESQLQGLTSSGDETSVGTVKDTLLRLDERRRGINGDLEKRRQELAEIETQLKGKSVLTALASRALLIVGIAIASLGIVLIFLTPFRIPAALAVALGIGMVIASLAAKNSISPIERDRKTWQKRIGEMESALADIEREETRVLGQMGCKSREEFNSKYALLYSLQQKLSEIGTKLSALLRGYTYEQLQEELREKARELAVEEQKLTDELKNTRLSPEDIIRYQEHKRQLEDEKKEKEGRKVEIEVHLKAAIDPEIVNQLEEELKSLEQEMSYLQRKSQACELARDFIWRARQETLEAVHNELQQKIQDYFSTFTDGKYKKVQLEPGTLECTIFSDEKGDWVKPEELSGGTIDQFYLAYRLALAQIIYRGRQPPLVLDDPFYNFDPIRLSRALASLKELSKNQQVIIFTLGDTYDPIADRVIELPTD